MSLIGSAPKQPIEILPFDISYAAVIGSRTASSITPTITVPAGMTQTSAIVSGTNLQIYVSGGTHLTGYRWVITTAIVIGGITTRVQDEYDWVINEISDTYSP